MDKDKDLPAIPRPSGAVSNVGLGVPAVLGRVVSDVLAVARTRGELSAQPRPRFKLGKYEFNEPDYRQLLLWSHALRLEPLAVLDRIEKSSNVYKWDQPELHLPFEVESGSMVDLPWDFNLLPLSSLEWADGLRIRRVRFKGDRTGHHASCQFACRS